MICVIRTLTLRSFSFLQDVQSRELVGCASAPLQYLAALYIYRMFHLCDQVVRIWQIFSVGNIYPRDRQTLDNDDMEEGLVFSCRQVL